MLLLLQGVEVAEGELPPHKLSVQLVDQNTNKNFEAAFTRTIPASEGPPTLKGMQTWASQDIPTLLAAEGVRGASVVTNTPFCKVRLLLCFVLVLVQV